MKYIYNTLVIGILGFLCAVQVNAAEKQWDDFKDCYGSLEGQVQEQEPQEELYVLIDQTFVLPEPLRKHVEQKISNYLDTEGRRVMFVSFSTFSQGQYSKKFLEGQLDFGIDEQQSKKIGKNDLRKFDNCRLQQKNYARTIVKKELELAFKAGSNEFKKTELIDNLFRFGFDVVSNSKAENKQILLVSDMFENSDTLSFYNRGSIDSKTMKRNLGKIQEEELASDFGGAEVFVIGAGAGSGKYIKASKMRKINKFWKVYFDASNARLVGWGQPELFNDI